MDHVIVPYVKNNRQSPEQKAMAVSHMFQAQHCLSVLGKLADNNMQVVFVPACCTAKLQPLDLTVKKDFHQWHAEQVTAQLQSMEDEGQIQTQKISTIISIIKLINTHWLIEAIE